MKLTEKFVQFISSLFFMMFLGIGIIRTEKCWPNSPTYSTDVGVLRGWGRAQITIDILGREAKKVEKHWSRVNHILSDKNSETFTRSPSNLSIS